MRTLRLLVVGLLAVWGCSSRPPFVVLTIEDPGNTATGFAALHVGTTLAALAPVSVSKTTLPLTITVTAKRTGDKTLWAEIRNQGGYPIARGTVNARFATSGTPTASLQLVKACSTDAACDDGLFCTGDETCVDGMCAAGPPACQTTFACVTMTCDEATRGCEVAVSHSLCPLRTACTVNFGCIPCGPLLCQTAEWCNFDTTDPHQGECHACDSPPHCGPACDVCSGQTPLCGGTAVGCICDTGPGPGGSCAPGTFCDGAACQPCNDTQHCGQNCLACTGATPVCAGVKLGCITNDCSDKPDMTRCQIVTTPTDRAYDICSAGQCVSPGCGDVTCNAPAPSFARADVDPAWRYPDTGQHGCRDVAGALTTCPGTVVAPGCAPTDAYCGQDAQYGWDTTHTPGDKYVRTNAVTTEPVVLDMVTGLMWQGCVAGVTGAQCEQGGPIRRALADAPGYCESLAWGGYSDWRLSDIFELESIVDAGVYLPASDATAFPQTGLAIGFWTLGYESAAGPFGWYVSSDSGMYGDLYASNLESIRCVRTAIAMPVPTVGTAANPRFVATPTTDNSLVVTDGKTGLMWQGCPSGAAGPACNDTAPSQYAWQDALAACEALGLDGYSDWRLPNRLELSSIVDFRGNAPAVDSAFPTFPTDHWFWTSTPFAGANNSAWALSFGVGFLSTWTMDDPTLYVRCVR